MNEAMMGRRDVDMMRRGDSDEEAREEGGWRVADTRLGGGGGVRQRHVVW